MMPLKSLLWAAKQPCKLQQQGCATTTFASLVALMIEGIRCTLLPVLESKAVAMDDAYEFRYRLQQAVEVLH